MSERDISSAIEMLGASRYMNADDDTFSVGMHGLAPDASTLLDLLSKIVLHPAFAPAEVSREHARILDRWNHIGDFSEALASLAYNRALSAGSDYGRGSFLSIAEFKKVGRTDVVAFHKRYFTPKNSLLMVVGRVAKPEFRSLIIEKFGSWKGEAPHPAWKKYSDPRVRSEGKRVLLVGRAGLTQAQVRIGFRAPPLKSPDHYSLIVANALLGEYFNSRLNSVIRDQLGLAYSVGSSFNYSRDLAKFTIATATRSEQVGPLILKTLEILKGLKKGPIADEEVRTAKEYLIGGFPLGVSTLSTIASRWLSGIVFDLGPDYLNEFVPKISAVTPAQVSAAVARDFDLDHLTIVVAGDPTEAGKSLSAAKLSTRMITSKDLQ